MLPGGAHRKIRKGDAHDQQQEGAPNPQKGDVHEKDQETRETHVGTACIHGKE
jgi:hypothetical protein